MIITYRGQRKQSKKKTKLKKLYTLSKITWHYILCTDFFSKYEIINVLNIKKQNKKTKNTGSATQNYASSSFLCF